MEVHLQYALNKAKILASKGKTTKAIAFLKESPYATFLGQGWDRHAFKISPRNSPSIVIKIDTHKSGVNQTRQEIHVISNHMHIYLPEVYDYDHGPSPKWITMEYLRPLKLTEPMPSTESIMAFAEEINAEVDELYSEHHWGMSRNKEPKILDFGF